MKNYALALSLLVLNVHIILSQVLINGQAQEVGISPEKLETVDAFIQRSIDQNVIAGGTFLIARKGKIAYEKSFGFTDVDHMRQYQNDDIYRLASMTKAVTSVAIMQLYEQGKLGLDDPIHYYIPAFREMTILDTYDEATDTYTTIPATKKITIRHLLTHTSGITYGDFNPGQIKSMYEKFDMVGVGLYHEEWTNEEFCNQLAKVPLIFEPGTKFLYGLNMDVLGRIVEVASGQELDEYFNQYVFQPLGMTDTYFNIPKNKQERLISIFSKDEKGQLINIRPGGLAGNPQYPLLADNQHYAGGGGLSSTAVDYARFIYALENDGRYNNYQLLSRKSIEIMTADQLIIQNEQGNGISKLPGITFGLGFMVHGEESKSLNAKSPGTYEWGGYFNTKFFIDPKEDLIFVGMTQIVPFDRPDFWERLYAIIYSTLE